MNTKKFKSFISNPFTITFLLLISLLVILTIKTIIKPNSFKELKNISNEVNSINIQISNKNNIDAKSFIESFDKNISKLDTLIQKTNSIKVSDDLKEQKALLISSINKNIEFYKNIIYTLENINSPSLIENNKKVLKSKSELEDSFKKLKNYEIELNLKDDKKTLISKSLNYINELIKLNRDSDITLHQNASFKTNIDYIYTEFAPLNEDLFEIIKLVKEDNRTLEPVLKSVNEKIEEFNKLNIELHSLSIPDGYQDYFQAMLDVFNNYEIYINQMRDYLISEVSKNPKKDLYNKAKTSYKTLNKSIISFQKLSTKYN